MKGAVGQTAPAGDLEVVDALRNQLFAHPGACKPFDDLVARNLQRAREHGIPSYGDLREACNMSSLDGSKPAEIDKTAWSMLMSTYSSPSEIDAFTGGLAETPASDGIVGPLFACIIKDQFVRLRDGDRYFFTHTPDASNSVRPLRSGAKANVLGRSLGSIMCDNDPTLGEIRPRVFEPIGGTNLDRKCGDHKKLDLEAIVEEIISM